jgi:hypothetical protein
MGREVREAIMKAQVWSDVERSYAESLSLGVRLMHDSFQVGPNQRRTVGPPVQSATAGQRDLRPRRGGAGELHIGRPMSATERVRRHPY